MSLSIRQAHNVLAQIAHAALLNGDNRNVVNEANTVLVQFIQKHEPTPAPEQPVAVKTNEVDRAIAAAGARLKAPNGAPKLDPMPPELAPRKKK